MSLDPIAIALQGFKKTPLALAVQGLVDLEVEPPDDQRDIFPGFRRRLRTKREVQDEEILLLVL